MIHGNISTRINIFFRLEETWQFLNLRINLLSNVIRWHIASACRIGYKELNLNVEQIQTALDVCACLHYSLCKPHPGSYCRFSVIVRSSCHLRVTLWLKTLRTWCLSMTQHRRTDSRLGKVSYRGSGRKRIGTMRNSRLTGQSNSC